jgi:hypothetical protein
MKDYVCVRWPYLVLAVTYTSLICFIAFGVIKPRISHTQVKSFNNIQFQATRHLPRNHRVRPVDIERPADLAGSLYWYLPRNDQIEGMYMKKSVEMGRPIRVDDVQAWPDLVPPKCCSTISISLQNQPLLVELLNAGSQVNLCPQAADCIASTRVLAVLCGKQQPACYAILEVSKGDEPKVREVVAKGTFQLIPTVFLETKGGAP